MSFKHQTVDNRDHTSYVFTTKWEFTVLALYKPGQHWWVSPKITWGVPGLLAEWMWGSEMDCLWFLCCGTMWIFRTHIKGFWQNGTESICFVILLDGYSSYSELVFPCFIHGDDIGFTLEYDIGWIEYEKLALCIRTILELDFMYIFIIYSRLLEFHSSFYSSRSKYK